MGGIQQQISPSQWGSGTWHNDIVKIVDVYTRLAQGADTAGRDGRLEAGRE